LLVYIHIGIDLIIVPYDMRMPSLQYF
jgi:hypothetical protein